MRQGDGRPVSRAGCRRCRTCACLRHRERRVGCGGAPQRSPATARRCRGWKHSDAEGVSEIQHLDVAQADVPANMRRQVRCRPASGVGPGDVDQSAQQAAKARQATRRGERCRRDGASRSNGGHCNGPLRILRAEPAGVGEFGVAAPWSRTRNASEPLPDRAGRQGGRHRLAGAEQASSVSAAGGLPPKGQGSLPRTGTDPDQQGPQDVARPAAQKSPGRSPGRAPARQGRTVRQPGNSAGGAPRPKRW